jgi:hypothetical protein
MANFGVFRMLEAARLQAGLTTGELWLRCFSLGGSGNFVQLQSFLTGRERPARLQYNIIAQALNERFQELDLDHPVPYFEDLVEPSNGGA